MGVPTFTLIWLAYQLRSWGEINSPTYEKRHPITLLLQRLEFCPWSGQGSELIFWYHNKSRIRASQNLVSLSPLCLFGSFLKHDVGLRKIVQIPRYSVDVCLHYDSIYFCPIDVLSGAGQREVWPGCDTICKIRQIYSQRSQYCLGPINHFLVFLCPY